MTAMNRKADGGQPTGTSEIQSVAEIRAALGDLFKRLLAADKVYGYGAKGMHFTPTTGDRAKISRTRDPSALQAAELFAISLPLGINSEDDRLLLCTSGRAYRVHSRDMSGIGGIDSFHNGLVAQWPGIIVEAHNMDHAEECLVDDQWGLGDICQVTPLDAEAAAGAFAQAEASMRILRERGQERLNTARVAERFLGQLAISPADGQ